MRTSPEGTVFYVDPNHSDANDGRDGTDPTSPLATVAAAIDRCSSYVGDVIVVGANNVHGTVRSLPITESVVIDKAGIRLVGVTDSSLGVYWEPAAGSGTCIVVGAPDVLIEGLQFVADTYAVGTGIDIQYDNANARWGYQVTVRHCAFVSNDYGIDLSAINGGQPTNCYLHDNWFGGCTFGIYDFDEGTLSHRIEGNLFDTCASAVWLTAVGCFVSGNHFHQPVLAGGDYLELGGGPGVGNGNNNFVTGNYFGCELPGGFGFTYNECCSSGDGLLIPISTDHWVGNFLWDGPSVDNPT